MEGLPALWVVKHQIKNESGFPIEFEKRKFLWDIYNDLSPKQVLLKPPQIGATVMNAVKSFYVANKLKRQIIYTLPTQGDVQDMVGSSFNRIIAQNPILKEWVKDHDTIEHKTVGETAIFYRGCVDEKTEILTENGWCSLGQVSIGDKLPSLNILTNTVEMDSVLGVSVFDVPENKMVQIKSRQIDQLVTSDHRCVVSKRTFSGNKSPLRIVRAHELVGKSTAYIPMKHNGLFSPNDVGDTSFYRVLGWVIGDGSYWIKRDKYTTKLGDKTATSNKVCIIQSKFCEELENHLQEAGIGYYKKRHNGTCWRYELNSKASNAVRQALPKKELTYSLVFNATSTERQALYEGLMMSDGNNYVNSRFYQNKGETVGAFQALMIFLGKTSANASQRKNNTVTIKTTNYSQVKAKVVSYIGKAWCPTTKNGTIFIRRNGIVSVTGQTFTAKQAMMIPSGLNIHDEVDASDPLIITQYQTRLQAQEDGGWSWYFSHPSLAGHGVDVYWQKSDKKEWHITCPHCSVQQAMKWPDNIDIQKQIYICSLCKKELQTNDRINGVWKNQDGVEWTGKVVGDYEFSGWHVTQLMLWNKTAKDIIKAFNDPLKDKQYFYNYVLGLPFIGSDDTIDPLTVLKNCVDEVNDQQGRTIIGMDTGHGIHYVLMNKQGVFFYNHATEITASKTPYDTIESLLRRFPKSVVISDQGGDLIGVRQLQAKYPGRVFLCFYNKDRKTLDLVEWGKDEEYGKVRVDRNRMMTLIIEQLRDIGRVRLNGTREEWAEFASHFGNIYREKVEVKDLRGKDNRQLYGSEYVWKRNGADHYVHGLLYAIVGLQRYGGELAKVVGEDFLGIPQAPFNNIVDAPKETNVVGNYPHKAFDTQSEM